MKVHSIWPTSSPLKTFLTLEFEVVQKRSKSTFSLSFQLLFMVFLSILKEMARRSSRHLILALQSTELSLKHAVLNVIMKTMTVLILLERLVQ